jgi:hypothetical protein
MQIPEQRALRLYPLVLVRSGDIGSTRYVRPIFGQTGRRNGCDISSGMRVDSGN